LICGVGFCQARKYAYCLVPVFELHGFITRSMALAEGRLGKQDCHEEKGFFQKSCHCSEKVLCLETSGEFREPFLGGRIPLFLWTQFEEKKTLKMQL